jgi:hypothetical protein
LQHRHQGVVDIPQMHEPGQPGLAQDLDGVDQRAWFDPVGDRQDLVEERHWASRGGDNHSVGAIHEPVRQIARQQRKGLNHVQMRQPGLF